jgi:hypothetical protein
MLPRCPSPSAVTHGLWSLWDLMLKKAALELSRVVAQIAQLEVTCAWSRSRHPEVLFDASGSLHDMSTQILLSARRACIFSDLDDVLPEITRFESVLGPQVRIEDVAGRASNLKNRILDELQNEHYFQVARQDVKFYGQKALFGTVVARRFKNAAQDIESAGNCLALQQPTACVFHLMRAMEMATRQLGRKLKVTITP